jgi:phosphate starvation-inducible protein PhoH and related proteins
MVQQEPKRTRRKTTYKNADNKQEAVLLPQNDRQSDYIEAIKSYNQIIVLGPAGTGKTYIAATYAANLYLTKQIDKIIITRPNVAAGKSIGYFPGTLEEKMMPWVMPVLEVLHWHMGKGAVETGIKNGNIEIAPFETMRGRSFKDAFVILDEAQNVTPHEIKMFLTRVGENCKVILNGDIFQSDLQDTSGLSKAIHMVKKYLLPVPVIEFQMEDIVRSDLCKQWISAFMQEEKRG